LRGCAPCSEFSLVTRPSSPKCCFSPLSYLPFQYFLSFPVRRIPVAPSPPTIVGDVPPTTFPVGALVPFRIKTVLLAFFSPNPPFCLLHLQFPFLSLLNDLGLYFPQLYPNLKGIRVRVIFLLVPLWRCTHTHSLLG